MVGIFLFHLRLPESETESVRNAPPRRWPRTPPFARRPNFMPPRTRRSGTENAERRFIQRGGGRAALVGSVCVCVSGHRRHFPCPQICSRTHTFRLIGLGLWHLRVLLVLWAFAPWNGGANATHFCIMHCWPGVNRRQPGCDWLLARKGIKRIRMPLATELSSLNKRQYREGEQESLSQDCGCLGW